MLLVYNGEGNLMKEEAPFCLPLLSAEVDLKRNDKMYSSLENCMKFFKGKMGRTRNYELF